MSIVYAIAGLFCVSGFVAFCICCLLAHEVAAREQQREGVED